MFLWLEMIEGLLKVKGRNTDLSFDGFFPFLLFYFVSFLFFLFLSFYETYGLAYGVYMLIRETVRFWFRQMERRCGGCIQEGPRSYSPLVSANSVAAGRSGHSSLY